MEKEIPESFKKWFKKHFKDNWDKVDIHAEYDRSLSVSENKNHFQDRFSMYFIESEKEEKQKAIAMEEKRKADLQEELKREEKELIERWKHEKLEVIDIKGFDMPRHMIRMVCKKISHGCIIVSSGGLGKSYQCLAELQQSGRNFVWLNTHVTPLAMFKLLYKYRDDIIVCDDVKGLVDNDISMSILKAALDDKAIRQITYETTSNKLEEVPETFEFRGQIIILTNRWRETIDTMAVASRIKPYFLEFSFNEKVTIMKHLVKSPYKGLALEEREFCLKKLLEKVDITTKNLNFRILGMAYRFYEYDKNRFGELLDTMIEVDTDLAIVKKLIERCNPDKQVSKWKEITGKSRATFFNKKKELLSKSKSPSENTNEWVKEQLMTVGIET